MFNVAPRTRDQLGRLSFPLLCFGPSAPAPVVGSCHAPRALNTSHLTTTMNTFARRPKRSVLVISTKAYVACRFVSQGKRCGKNFVSPNLRVHLGDLGAFATQLPLIKDRKRVPRANCSARASVHTKIVRNVGCRVRKRVERFLRGSPSLLIFLAKKSMFSFSNGVGGVVFTSGCVIPGKLGEVLTCGR